MYYLKSFMFLVIVSFIFSACGHKTNPKYVTDTNTILNIESDKIL